MILSTMIMFPKSSYLADESLDQTRFFRVEGDQTGYQIHKLLLITVSMRTRSQSIPKWFSQEIGGTNARLSLSSASGTHVVSIARGEPVLSLHPSLIHHRSQVFVG